MTELTVKKQVYFRRGRRTRKKIKEGRKTEPKAVGSVPRISRLMALAIHMQELVERGEVVDYADLARLAHVTRARITQIMNLNLLAPDIQEEILNLPPSNDGRDPIAERNIRHIVAIPDWRLQRKMWRIARRRVHS
ncbi:MAG TPA: hypothetical protein VM487_06390, partial [Phycisphaerae bacterium]|nr:hypothetical protein [Phycisphaerae bacterium]